MQRSDRRMERIRTVLRHRRPDLTVVLENIHDPHNVSAILRTCDAVGVPRVELLYSTEQFPDLGGKSASSGEKWVERRKHRSVDDCYRFLRSEGFLICATYLDGQSSSLFELDLTKKTALVFGNEHRGVSDEAAGKADVRFRIPMEGMSESLNVSVACAVVLYEAFRQRDAASDALHAGLSDAEMQRLFDEWTRR